MTAAAAAIAATSPRRRSATVTVPAQSVDDAAATGLAEVATATRVGDLGLAVVSVVAVPVRSGFGSWPAAVVAPSLLAVAAVAVAVIWLGLVAPVRRLRQAAALVASGYLAPKRRWGGSGEVRRIASALEAASARFRSRTSAERPRRGWPALVAVLVAALLVVAWPVALAVLCSRTPVVVPAQVQADTGNRVSGVAAALNSHLAGGLARLQDLAAGQPGGGSAAPVAGLDALLAQTGMRSAYVVGADGQLTGVVGREPLRGPGVVSAAPGVELDESVRRVPAIFAHAALPDGRVLVGEFNPHAIIGLLHRLEGHTILIDASMRTLVSTDGFVAFALPPAPVRQAGAAVLKQASDTQPDVRLTRFDGSDAIVAAAAVRLASSPMQLAVVSVRSTSEYALAVNELKAAAWLIALLAVFAGALLGGWYFFVVLRPLRRLARSADRLVAGDLSAAIYPAGQDEVGAIAVCLEVCRQAAKNGMDRLGGVSRMRGTVGDRTSLLARAVPRPRRSPEPRTPGAGTPRFAGIDIEGT